MSWRITWRKNSFIKQKQVTTKENDGLTRTDISFILKIDAIDISKMEMIWLKEPILGGGGLTGNNRKRLPLPNMTTTDRLREMGWHKRILPNYENSIFQTYEGSNSRSWGATVGNLHLKGLAQPSHSLMPDLMSEGICRKLRLIDIKRDPKSDSQMRYFHWCINGLPSCFCISLFSLIGHHRFYIFSSGLKTQSKTGMLWPYFNGDKNPIFELTQTNSWFVLAIHEITANHELSSWKLRFRNHLILWYIVD